MDSLLLKYLQWLMRLHGKVRLPREPSPLMDLDELKILYKEAGVALARTNKRGQPAFIHVLPTPEDIVEYTTQRPIA